MKRQWPSIKWLGLLICVGLSLNSAAQEAVDEQTMAEALHQAQAQGPAPEGGWRALPGGALLHVRLRGLTPLIDMADTILKDGAPKEALPPELRDILDEKSPALAFAGMKLRGYALEEKEIGEVLGVDPEREITLTLYPGNPQDAFVLSLPIGEEAALARLLVGLIKPQTVQTAGMEGGGKVVRCEVDTARGIRVWAAVSSKRVYLTKNRGLAAALYREPGSDRLGNNPFLQRALERASGADLAVVCDGRALQVLSLFTGQADAAVQGLLRAKREQIFSSLDDFTRRQIQFSVQQRLGVDSLEQFADYLEAVAVGTVDFLSQGLSQRLVGFQGVALGLALDGRRPGLSLSIYSAEFDPARAAAPLPMDQIREALQWTGTDWPVLSAVGRKPRPEGARCLKAWLASVQRELAARNLPLRFFGRLGKLAAEWSAEPPVESFAPWTLTIEAPFYPPPSPDEAASLLDYFRRIRSPLYGKVRLMPADSIQPLKEALAAQVKAANGNRRLLEDFWSELAQVPSDAALLKCEADVRAEEVAPDVWELARIARLQTSFGLFGFDQHELVSRRVYHARVFDGALLFHRGIDEAPWLRTAEPERKEILPAVDRLLAMVPEGADWFHIERRLPHLPGWIDWFAKMEQLARRDLDNYLRRAKEIIQARGLTEEGYRALGKLQMPDFLVSLNRDPDTGRIYGLLPGLRIYPRPPIGDVLENLIRDYRREAPSLGGCLLTARTGKGVYEFQARFSLQSLTRLIATVGNRLHADYLADPERKQVLFRRLYQPREGDPALLKEALLVNQRWLGMVMAARRVQEVPESSLLPEAPTPPRESPSTGGQ